MRVDGGPGRPGSGRVWRLHRAEQLAEQTGHPYAFAGELGLARVALDFLGGRWDAALEGLRTVAAELAVREQAMLAAALRAIELEMRTWRGELAVAAGLAAGPLPALAATWPTCTPGRWPATRRRPATPVRPAATLRAALRRPGRRAVRAACCCPG